MKIKIIALMIICLIILTGCVNNETSHQACVRNNPDSNLYCECIRLLQGEYTHANKNQAFDNCFQYKIEESNESSRN